MKKTKGLTFLEILIAIVIVGIVLSSMLTGMNFASKYARHNANKTMALNFAQGVMEELRDVRYADLDDYDEYTDTVFLYQGEGVDTVQTTLGPVEVTGVVIDSVAYKTVKVPFSWDWQGKSYTGEVYTLNTLRSDY